MARQFYDRLDLQSLNELDQTLYASLEKLETLYAGELRARRADAEAGDLPRVRLHTSQGEIEIELFLDQAPSAVSHFLQKVEAGEYDGAEFIQVIEDTFAVAGDETRPIADDAGRYLVDEHQREDHRAAVAGSVAMMKVPSDTEGNYHPNSASHPFGIMLMPLPRISETHTVIGHVVDGMMTVAHLRRVNTAKTGKNEVVKPPDRIYRAEVIRRPESLPKPVYVGR